MCAGRIGPGSHPCVIDLLEEALQELLKPYREKKPER
jgi:hypothetical protein